MRKLTTILIIVATVIAIAHGATPTEQERLPGYDAGTLPGPISSLISDERINVYITEKTQSWESVPGADTRTLGFVTNAEGGLESVQNGSVADATFEIMLAKQTLRDAARSDNMQASLIQAYQGGAIKYRGLGTWNSMLTGTTKAMTGVATHMYDGVTTVTRWFS